MSKKFWTSLVVSIFAVAILGGGIYTLCNYDDIKDKIQGGNGSHKPVNPDIPTDPEFPLTFVVKFLGYEKTEVQTIAIGDYAKEPAIPPQKEGYVFKGWMISDTIIKVSDIIINQNITFVPCFIKTFKITYSVGDVTKTFTQEEGFLKYGLVEYIIPNGFVFDYWLCNGQKVESLQDITVVRDIRLEAVLTQIHEVSFYDRGTLFIKDVRHGELVEIKEPNAPGYKFIGWANSDDIIVDLVNYPIVRDEFLTAKFEEVEMEKLEFTLTDEQIQTIKQNGWNPAFGGVALEVIDFYYCAKLKTIYFYLRGVDRATRPVYNECGVQVEKDEDISPEYIIEQISIENNPLIYMHGFKSAKKLNNEYFESNKESQYEFENRRFSLENIYIELASSFKDGKRTYFYYMLAINEDGSILKINQKDDESYIYDDKSITDSDFCSILLEKFKV